MSKSITLALILFLPAIGIAQEESSIEKLAGELLESAPSDTITKQETFETNGFIVESAHIKTVGANLKPTGAQKDLLVVTSETLFKVIVEKLEPKSRSGSVALFHPKSGTPMLIASDVDGDGRIDYLSHSVLNKEGEAIYSVSDYEADGQPDLKIHFKDEYAEIWHNGKWYRIQKEHGNAGIIVNGKFIALKTQDNRLVVP